MGAEMKAQIEVWDGAPGKNFGTFSPKFKTFLTEYSCFEVRFKCNAIFKEKWAILRHFFSNFRMIFNFYRHFGGHGPPRPPSGYALGNSDFEQFRVRKIFCQARRSWGEWGLPLFKTSLPKAQSLTSPGTIGPLLIKTLKYCIISHKKVQQIFAADFQQNFK
jgi:hypothetical protein